MPSRLKTPPRAHTRRPRRRSERPLIPRNCTPPRSGSTRRASSARAAAGRSRARAAAPRAERAREIDVLKVCMKPDLRYFPKGQKRRRKIGGSSPCVKALEGQKDERGGAEAR